MRVIDELSIAFNDSPYAKVENKYKKYRIFKTQ